MNLKILLVYRHPATFIENDCKILKKYFAVYTHRTKFSIKNLLKLFLLINKVDLVFAWFANWSAVISLLFSKLMKKKFIVVGGGLDSTWILKKNKIKNLEIRGLFEKIQKIISKFVFNHADFVIPVSKFAMKGILLISKPKRIKVVYNGIPIRRITKCKKQNIVLTVGSITNLNIKKKGLLTFAKVTTLLPEIKFFIIGSYNEKSLLYRILRSIGGKNLYFTGYLDKNELFKFMSKAKVYCQLSYSESFGYALAEAMLHQCIPIVTKRAALPEVVGNTGFYVKYGDYKRTARTIKKVLNLPKNLGKKARKRIVEKFNIERRGKELVNIIKCLMSRYETSA
jgi:glycosyltransferase involved in cell wall biosynthesis